MASRDARRRAIEEAVERVHSWPVEMHRSMCRCVRHDSESKCECRACSRVRAAECVCCGQPLPAPGDDAQGY